MPTMTTASTATVILRRNSRLGKIFLDAGCRHVEGRLSRRRRRGCGRLRYNSRRRFRTARYLDADQDGLLDDGDTDITAYRWDVRNRLIRVEDYADYASLSGALPEQAVDYLYDVENRWIGESIDSNGDGTIDRQIRLVYDGNQIVLQFEKEGEGAVTGQNVRNRLLWQPNAVDQLMAEERTHLDAGNIVSDEVLWALTDRQGSVNDLAKYNATTGATAVVDHIIRNSFGKVISETDPSQGSLIGWTGRPVDKATGQQNNLHRWYDPIIAGWMTQDPIGFYGAQTNLYVYCGNSPTNATDPTGCLTPGAKALLDYYATKLFALNETKQITALIAEALRLTKGDAAAALALVMEVRNAGAVPGNNDVWASTDHYLNALAAKQLSGVRGSLGATIGAFGYHILKFWHIPVGRDNPNIPPSPPTSRQLFWGIMGAW